MTMIREYETIFLHTKQSEKKKEKKVKQWKEKSDEESWNLQIYFLTNCKEEYKKKKQKWKTYYEKMKILIKKLLWKW